MGLSSRVSMVIKFIGVLFHVKKDIDLMFNHTNLEVSHDEDELWMLLFQGKLIQCRRWSVRLTYALNAK